MCRHTTTDATSIIFTAQLMFSALPGLEEEITLYHFLLPFKRKTSSYAIAEQALGETASNILENNPAKQGPKILTVVFLVLSTTVDKNNFKHERETF